MKRSFRTTLLALALLTPHAPALAWGDTGHMVVAYVAYVNLNKKAKARVNHLLRPSPEMPDARGLVFFCERTYDPVTIANWMDDMRDDSLHDDLKPWHFANRNPLVVGDDFEPQIDKADVDVLERVEWAAAELAKVAAGADENYDRRAKREAELVGFLYHLVGDLHQPLHTATRYTRKRPRGDAGGNLFPVVVPNTRVKNLHSYWDAAGGFFNFQNLSRPLDEEGRAAVAEFTREAMETLTREEFNAKWAKRTPAEWVGESNRLAREVAFANIKENETPSAEYAAEAQRISRMRIALAGYRLAEIFNGLLGKP